MENEGSFLEIFSDLTFEKEPSRTTCLRCRRPSCVCLCEYLPNEVLPIKNTTLHILQHPNEENRPLNTVSILAACLPKNACHIYKGRKFSPQGYPDLHEVLLNGETFLLFPGEDAIDIEEALVPEHIKSGHCNILLLDGTWKQAASIYNQNKFLKKINKVQLKISTVSEYVIRTQPNDNSVSTLECAAIALSHAEQDTQIKEVSFPRKYLCDFIPMFFCYFQALLKPLRALCKFQLDHGAVVHQSKEYVAKHGPDSVKFIQ
uniref:tRNA-uridine aminocarboxypropyltransferase n=1 Tax=Phallusia mammillata TaxID=59560 RepID=A0A6F9DB98_9ASCI|nr:DTW domain-containing protein 2-like [Phallusia mammillata]